MRSEAGSWSDQFWFLHLPLHLLLLSILWSTGWGWGWGMQLKDWTVISLCLPPGSFSAHLCPTLCPRRLISVDGITLSPRSWGCSLDLTNGRCWQRMTVWDESISRCYSFSFLPVLFFSLTSLLWQTQGLDLLHTVLFTSLPASGLGVVPHYLLLVPLHCTHPCL